MLKFLQKIDGVFAIYKCMECYNFCIKNKYYVNNNRIKSCGCLKPTTQFYKIPEYGVRRTMLARCYNKNRVEYKDYGGRGIKVCQSWKTSFEIFYKDMGQRPTKKHTLERINNNGDYCPENCYWSTRKNQNNNKRNNVMVTFQNKTQNISQWSNELNIRYGLLYSRIVNLKWEIEKAFTVPPIQKIKKPKRS